MILHEQLMISLIIPCYNTEKYIETCLNSVFKQDISEETYEVICVNDCSTDKTVEIIEKYKQNRTNLVLLHQSTNQKQGAARNVGLKHARGKYIWFIDSDDFIVENCLSKILKELADNQLEILQFNIDVTDRLNYQSVLDVNLKSDTEVISGVNYLNILMLTHWGRTIEVWRKVFKKEFLLTHYLTFPEYVFGTEDLMFFYQTIVKCQRYKHVTQICYNYRTDNQDSVTNGEKALGLKLADKIIANVDVIKFFKEDKLIQDSKFVNTAIESYKWSLRIYIRKIFKLEKSELDIFLRKIKKHKNLLSDQLGILQTVLLTSPLLIKFINIIFVTIYKSVKR